MDVASPLLVGTVRWWVLLTGCLPWTYTDPWCMLCLLMVLYVLAMEWVNWLVDRVVDWLGDWVRGLVG